MSASTVRPSRDKDRRTTNNRTHRERQPDTPPRARPASHWGGAARGAPRPSRASAADRRGSRAAVGTATLRAVRRRVPRVSASRCQQHVPGSDKCLWRPGSAPGSRQSLAEAARSQTAVAITRGPCASTVSRPASRSPAVGQRERAYLRLRTAGVADRYTVTQPLITSTGFDDHDRPESVITFHRIG